MQYAGLMWAVMPPGLDSQDLASLYSYLAQQGSTLPGGLRVRCVMCGADVANAPASVCALEKVPRQDQLSQPHGNAKPETRNQEPGLDPRP
eukprot:383460-Rhodomonas_salina.1